MEDLRTNASSTLSSGARGAGRGKEPRPALHHRDRGRSGARCGKTVAVRERSQARGARRGRAGSVGLPAARLRRAQGMSVPVRAPSRSRSVGVPDQPRPRQELAGLPWGRAGPEAAVSPPISRPSGASLARRGSRCGRASRHPIGEGGAPRMMRGRGAAVRHRGRTRISDHGRASS